MTDKIVLTEAEANALLQQKLSAAKALISECEDLALEHKLSFSLNIAYGMGGWFNGVDEDEEYYNEHPDERPEDWHSSFEPGWQASSQSC